MKKRLKKSVLGSWDGVKSLFTIWPPSIMGEVDRQLDFFFPGHSLLLLWRGRKVVSVNWVILSGCWVENVFLYWVGAVRLEIILLLLKFAVVLLWPSPSPIFLDSIYALASPIIV